MVSELPRTILNDLIVHQKGFPFKSRDYQDNGVPVVRVSNFTSDSIDISDLKYISDKVANENQKAALRKDDVVIATVGSWPKNPASIVGKTICVPLEMDGALMNQNSVILRVKSKSVVDQKYLFIALKTKLFSEYLVSTAQGSANQASVKLSDVFSYEVEWPEQEIRESIVSIIDSMNQKIKLNRQTNQTLEHIAQALFKSWFVDFEPVKAKIKAKQTLSPTLSQQEKQQIVQRAAMCAISGKTDAELDQFISRHDVEGSTNVAGAGSAGATLQQLKTTADLFPDTLVDSELGEIPEGWEQKTFGDISQCFDSKRIPLSKKKREEKKPGNIPYYGATSIMDYVNEWIFDDIFLLLGEDGSVVKEDGTPFIQYIWNKAWVNNHAHVLQGKNGVSTEQLMIFMKSQNIAAYITGAVQLKLNQGNMNSIPFLDAGEILNATFYEVIKPLYSKFRKAVEENHELTELRDTLLPKLLSGEIKINDAVETNYE